MEKDLDALGSNGLALAGNVIVRLIVAVRWVPGPVRAGEVRRGGGRMKRGVGFSVVELLVVVTVGVAVAALVGGRQLPAVAVAGFDVCFKPSASVSFFSSTPTNPAVTCRGRWVRSVQSVIPGALSLSIALVQKQVSPGDFVLHRSRGRIGVLRCSSHPSTGQVMETGFSMNGYIPDSVDRPWGVVGMTIQRSVKRPSEVVHRVDVSDALPCVLLPRFILEGTSRWADFPDGPILTRLQTVFHRHNLPGGVQERVARDRHGRGWIHALYMDGQVEAVRWGDLTMRDFDDGVRGNRRVVGWDG